MENINMKTSLTEKQLMILQTEMSHRKKSTGITYLLFVLLGAFGGHQFYLRETGKGILYLCCTIGAIIAGIIGFGSDTAFFLFCFLIGILAVSLIGDIFKIPKQVQTCNNNIESNIIKQMAQEQE